jgi:MscS family membrane protein
MRQGLTAALLCALAASAQTPLIDPFGRSTPRGTVLGFLHAAQRDNLLQASAYLQVAESERENRGVRLARQLSAVLDRALSSTLDSISNAPEGDLNDGLPPERERAGILTVDGLHIPLALVRVKDRDGRQLWLISTETLSQVPALSERIGLPWLEHAMPWVLERHRLLGIPLWQWLAAILLLPVAIGLGWIGARLVLGPLRRLFRFLGRESVPAEAWRSPILGPMTVILAMPFHLLLVNALGFSLLYRYYYYRLVIFCLIAGIAWLFWRLVDQGFRRGLETARIEGRGAAASLLQLGRRLLKATIVVGVLLACLHALGFQTTGIIAGLGIGGIAVALAAQKTIENLFGGLSLVSDEVFRIGDVCKAGDRVGVIEDIGLRSTRIRTKERSELSIPNGALAAMNIENLSRRDKILLEKMVTVRVEATSARLEQILSEARKLVESHPKLIRGEGRVRLVNIDEVGHRLEIFAFVDTTDYLEFLSVQEEILLRIVAIVRAAGAELASKSPPPPE